MKNKASFTAPFLLCVVFGFLCVSGTMVDAVQSVSANSYISVSIIQIFVLLLPAAFYCGIRRISFFSSVIIRPVRLRDMPFLLLCSLTFFFGVATLKFLSYVAFGAAKAHTASLIAELPFGTSNTPLVLLCFILLLFSMVLMVGSFQIRFLTFQTIDKIFTFPWACRGILHTHIFNIFHLLSKSILMADGWPCSVSEPPSLDLIKDKRRIEKSPKWASQSGQNFPTRDLFGLVRIGREIAVFRH